MGRVYSAAFEDVAVSAIQDFLELVAPSDAAIRVLSIIVGQSSDYGDAAAEGLAVRISRATGSGSGGSTLTPRPHHVGDPAFGGTVEANNTTQATGTTVIHADAFNIQAGWHYRPIPEEMIWVSPSGIIVVEMPTAPADALTVSGTITFEVLGG